MSQDQNRDKDASKHVKGNLEDRAHRGGAAADRPTQREPQLPAGLKSVEATLAALTPRRDRLDADLVMFRAGQRSVHRGRRWQPLALAGMSAAAAVFLTMFFARPEPTVLERVRIVRVPMGEQNDAPEAPPSDKRQSAEPVEAPAAEVDLDFRLADRPSFRAMQLARLDNWLHASPAARSRPVESHSETVSGPSPPLGYFDLLEQCLEEQCLEEQTRPATRSTIN